MTSSQWLACQKPNVMTKYLSKLGGRPTSRRVRRLLACGYCRQGWHLLVDERSRDEVELAERMADGRAGIEEVNAARARALPFLFQLTGTGARGSLAIATIRLISPEGACPGVYHWIPPLIWDLTPPARRGVIAAAQCDLIRDIFGDPSHPQPFDPSSFTPTVAGLARDIYDHRDYEKMPYLGDALEEAGCASARVLEHCRAGPAHARGCWVLDALTGRAGT